MAPAVEPDAQNADCGQPFHQLVVIVRRARDAVQQEGDGAEGLVWVLVLCVVGWRGGC